jgi:hypothetical protein
MSQYIHFAVNEKGENVWIAQREGRAKDSDDRTQEAVLKMFAMGGEGSVIDRLKHLHIVPLAISYEYDPCDYLKAEEFQFKRDVVGWKKSKQYDLDNMNEYPLCVALYYLGEQVSNYLVMPWQFNEKGSLSFVAKSDLTIDSFPALLRDGGYTYIWIHSYDKYLTEQFERLFNCKELQKGLYRIMYQEDGAIRLEYVSDLKRGAEDK